MKSIIIALVFIFTNNCAVAQPTDPNNSTTHITHMEIFIPWQGQWKGEGLMNRNGQQQKFHIEEHIAMKLGGSIVTVEGIGRETPGENGKIVHHAYGVLNYEASTNSYNFRSYLADGKSTNAWFIVSDKSKYQWGFDVPSGKIRYTIVVDAASGTWNETGEYSGDGNKWFQFLTMSLTKVD